MPVIRQIGERTIPYLWRAREQLCHFECYGLWAASFVRDDLSGIGGEREDDIEELIMGREDELTTEVQEILNVEHQKTQRNVSPSEQEENESGRMPTSAIKDLLKKWADVRAMVFGMTTKLS
ncbi:uncharacterized protein TNCV_2708811 [Trichonephila clavipes]|nr:uncharacterized protein TNCV_2708811 [Trichonephila clavipes]